MITVAQIREARKLLGWSPLKLAGRAKIHSAILRRAEGVEGEPPLTGYQHALIGATSCAKSDSDSPSRKPRSPIGSAFEIAAMSRITSAAATTSVPRAVGRCAT